MGSLTFERISHYRVLRELKPTRLGRVYLSISTEDRSGVERGPEKSRSPGFFCVELLNAEWAQDYEVRALFLDEAAQTLQLEHPNVVRTQEVIAEPTAAGRVTRWFAGHSLAGLLERTGREAFPLHLHVRVLCEVLSALQYLHELEDPSGAAGGLVYRDASPERVFLTYTGQVKLLGAGFERTIDELERRAGHLLADIGYASPELCLGYPPSPSGDVYSVGVMLWEALARARRAFADTPEASLRMRISGEEPDVQQFRPGVPERLAQICGRALAVSPRDRYPNAQELQIDLESFLADTETDAQQNAGLGALAQLMMQHFAAERAEMLTWIEQQLASLDRSAEPSADRPAADATAQTASLRAVVAPEAPAVVIPPDLPEPAPERWDEHTHNVTSFEELLPVEPAAQELPELASELPAAVRDPDTSGHRAYSSTFQPGPSSVSSISRVAVPIALAAGVLLLVAQGVRIAQRAPSTGADRSTSSAPAERSERHDGRAHDVSGVGALRPQAQHPELPRVEGKPPATAPPLSLPASADAGVLALPAFLAGASVKAAAPVESMPTLGAAPVEPRDEPSMPTLTADALEPSATSRPAAKPRRAKPRPPEARSEPRAARPSNLLPRSIDETDPYLE